VREKGCKTSFQISEELKIMDPFFLEVKDLENGDAPYINLLFLLYKIK